MDSPSSFVATVMKRRHVAMCAACLWVPSILAPPTAAVYALVVTRLLSMTWLRLGCSSSGWSVLSAVSWV